MGAVSNTLNFVLEIYKWILLARVLISWLPAFGVSVSPYNPLVRLLYQVTDPILRPLSSFARLGMFDLSPLIAFFLIGFLQNLLLGYSLSHVISLIIGLTIAFSVHECAHAWAADQLGDSTARRQGRLTLDPRKHLDVLGSLMVLVAGFGWAKPTPVNPYRLRYGPETGLAMVSLTGPLSNLGLAVLGAIPIWLGMVASPQDFRSLALSPSAWEIIPGVLPGATQLFNTFIVLNLMLFVFNLLPIAPLDGFSVLLGLLPYHSRQSFRRLERLGPIILLGLILLGPLFLRGFDPLGFLIRTPANLLYRLLV